MLNLFRAAVQTDAQSHIGACVLSVCPPEWKVDCPAGFWFPRPNGKLCARNAHPHPAALEPRAPNVCDTTLPRRVGGATGAIEVSGVALSREWRRSAFPLDRWATVFCDANWLAMDFRFPPPNGKFNPWSFWFPPPNGKLDSPELSVCPTKCKVRCCGLSVSPTKRKVRQPPTFGFPHQMESSLHAELLVSPTKWKVQPLELLVSPTKRKVGQC
jgi:hypothetical protein